MPSRVVRVSEDVLEIALKYGKNLAEGVRTMEKIIEQQKECKFTPDIIESMVREIVREELEMLKRY